MAKIIKEREWVEEIHKERFFHLIGETDQYAGIYIPLDENDNLSFTGEGMKENYEFALNHPEKYEDMGIRTEKRRYKNDAIALCECGKEIELYDAYLGACDCPYCGRWHNLFGQELTPPPWNDNEDY